MTDLKLTGLFEGKAETDRIHRWWVSDEAIYDVIFYFQKKKESWIVSVSWIVWFGGLWCDGREWPELVRWYLYHCTAKVSEL